MSAKYYEYDEVTKELIGEFTPVISPKGTVLLPVNVTDVEPLPEIQDTTQVFGNNSWGRKTDLRGKNSYRFTDGLLVVIDYIGDVEEGFTATPPPLDNDYPVWDDSTSTWGVDSLARDAGLIAAAKELAEEKRVSATELILGRSISASKDASYEFRNTLAKVILDPNADSVEKDKAVLALENLAAVAGVTVEEYAQFTVEKNAEIKEAVSKFYMNIDSLENLVQSLVESNKPTEAATVLSAARKIGIVEDDVTLSPSELLTKVDEEVTALVADNS